MVDMNKLALAYNDKKNKAVFNNLLLDMFNELGGADAGAVDKMVTELNGADIPIKRASVIGKLSIMGVKTIVKKAEKPAKKDEGPSKKDLIRTFIEVSGADINKLSTLPNLKKADIAYLIELFNQEDA